MRVLPFFAQNATLAHSEPVLLVDDTEPQPAKFNPFLQDRMGTDNQMNASGTNLLQRLSFLPCRLRSGEKDGAQTEFAKPVAELPVMLFSEDFGGGDNCDLRLVLDGNQRRHQGNDGLAAADVTLHQSMHRMRRHEIQFDLPQNPALGGGQTPGEKLRQWLGVTVRHLKGDSRC